MIKIPSGQTDFFLNVTKALYQKDVAKNFILAAHADQAQLLASFLSQQKQEEILLLKDWELMPYDWHFVDPEIIEERFRTLYLMMTQPRWTVVTSPSAIAPQLPPLKNILSSRLSWKVGQTLKREDLISLWTSLSYQQVPQVTEPGDFAIRGEVLDVYLQGQSSPLRLVIVDDVLESLKRFDPQTQRTYESLAFLSYTTSRQWPIEKNAFTIVQERFKKNFPLARKSAFYKNLELNKWPKGIDFFTPLLWGSTESFQSLECLKDTRFFIHPQSEMLYEHFFQKAQEHYQSASLVLGWAPYSPQDIFHQPENLSFLWDRLSDMPQNSPIHDLHSLLKQDNITKVYSVVHPSKLGLLKQKLSAIGLSCSDSCTSLTADLLLPNSVIVSPFETAFLVDEKTLIVPYHALAQRPLVLSEYILPVTKQKAQRRLGLEEDLWSDVQYVIYQEHGIARYHGLKTLEIGGHLQELLELEYDGPTKLYLPLDEIEHMTPYRVSQDEGVVLHKIGQGQWNKEKQKALKIAHDHAADLLALYSQKQHAAAFAHSLPESYADFEAEFPFIPTSSQQEAFKAIAHDLTQAHPMDRLLCGDVGFGKTEVALRAAFIAAKNHKQVIVLAPTTILAQQHFETFFQRLSHWNLPIALMTRHTKKDAEQLEKISKGLIKIIIGTHRVLEKDLHYHDLSLMIIDEEHRFGVKDKERIQQLRGHMHLLSMTATPIPRTLSMALEGLRDLSLMTTPPASRRKILTSVHQYSHAIVQQGIERELFRSGQVYYLCNAIEKMEKKVALLKTLCPQAQIAYVHGQMSPREIEERMTLFYQHHIDVLVCSTIIETGIDVPKAHTIFIEDAQNFGLAQLHQLRGRVGRSSHQSYAYCLIPLPLEHLSPTASSRLEALCRYQDLGSGYHIATEDMELRGAGEILGAKQSGHIQTLGLDYYQKLLRQAYDQQSAPSVETLPSIKIDWGMSLPLSHKQIPDPLIRLVMYRQAGQLHSFKDFLEMEEEFADRFGRADPLSLLWLKGQKIRVLALELGVHHLSFLSKAPLIITFVPKSPALEACIRLIRQGLIQAAPYGSYGLTIKVTESDLDKRLDRVLMILGLLSNHLS